MAHDITSSKKYDSIFYSNIFSMMVWSAIHVGREEQPWQSLVAIGKQRSLQAQLLSREQKRQKDHRVTDTSQYLYIHFQEESIDWVLKINP